MQPALPPHPLVTIAIGNFNYARYLDRAISSAIGQTYPRIEVLVIDDGSTDHSRDVIAGWQGKVTAVFKANGGQISVYNEAIARAQGDILIFLDADDHLDAGAVERIVAAFQPGVVKVHYKLRLVNADDRPLGGTIPNRLSSGDEPRRLLMGGYLYDSAPGSGNAYAVWALRKVAPLPAMRRDKHGGDFFAVYSMPFLGHISSVNEVLGSYRVHHESVTSALTFGNANRGKAEPLRTSLRYRMLRRWLAGRLPGVVLPRRISDFSLEKIGFASAVFGSGGYVAGLMAGGRRLAPLCRSIAKRPGNPLAKPMLLAWAGAVLLLPRPWGEPIARYICNPASRNRT